MNYIVVWDARVWCRRVSAVYVYILELCRVCIEVAKVDNAAAATSIPMCQFFRLYRRSCCDSTVFFFVSLLNFQ